MASYNAPYGIALAASREAKLYGIKTGTRISDAKKMYPNLIVVEPDSDKYRFVHLALRKLLEIYTPSVIPKSIDEFVLDLSQSPIVDKSSFDIALEIKKRIKQEIGEWITVSIGVGPSRFLAKTGAGIKKPDGLDEINYKNYESIYKNMPIGDLCGIGFRSEPRLRVYGLNTAWDLYATPLPKLKYIFRSIHAYYWYRKLRGWPVEDIWTTRKSIGNSYVMPACQHLSAGMAGRPNNILPVLAKLVDKTAHRMRKAGYGALGVGVHARFEDHTYWVESHKFRESFFATSDIYTAAKNLLMSVDSPSPIRKIGVTCFNLVPLTGLQLELFSDTERKHNLAQAMDTIKKRWGTYTITSARMIATQKYVPDRIAFGLPAMPEA